MKRATVLFLILLAADAREKEAALLQQAAALAAKQANPLQHSEPAARAGAKLFAHECAACHGARREGSQKAPPLDRADVRRAPPGALFWVLRNGALRHGMPSFAHLPELERWQIVTFLQEVPEAKSRSQP